MTTCVFFLRVRVRCNSTAAARNVTCGVPQGICRGFDPVAFFAIGPTPLAGVVACGDDSHVTRIELLILCRTLQFQTESTVRVKPNSCHQVTRPHE